MSSVSSKTMTRERHEIITTDTYFDGKNIQITDTLIGKGSFGHIYEVHVDGLPILAAKLCPIENLGVPDILEASIMSSIDHPYINKALFIGASPKKLYIIQERAKCDLSYYTRKTKRPSLDQLRHWCHQLACAVSALHQNNIIHADIKTSNVLLYADNNVKLTDFTLSVVKSEPTQKFKLSACTATYRPLECWDKYSNGSWDTSLDIWSLGCTFYEIAYGESLFKDQGVKGSPDRRQMFIDALIDWGGKGPTVDKDYGNFRRPAVTHEFFESHMTVFNDLICSMLKVKADERVTIAQVLNHPFFNRMEIPSYEIKTRESQKISTQETRRVNRYMNQITTNEHTCHLAYRIYSQCTQLCTMAEKLKAVTCVYIASKILYTHPDDIKNSGFATFVILEAERKICQDLFFRFYPY